MNSSATTTRRCPPSGSPRIRCQAAALTREDQQPRDNPARHGGRGRRGWRKLHLGVDGSRVIVAGALTEPTADDAITGDQSGRRGGWTPHQSDGGSGLRHARVLWCGRCARGAGRGAADQDRVVVSTGARSGARDRTIRRVKALGRRRWKKASGSHQHARVENAFFRYTSIVGDCLRARSSSGQRREAVLACNVLNPEDRAWQTRLVPHREVTGSTV